VERGRRKKNGTRYVTITYMFGGPGEFGE